ncbi:hypothetical protein NM208_g6064 [Fusarium decemcellulare]|uniref:Uncharacterized protein n=1 Tax=Fusarium decemcellulare TaxID=57161 RepID=A0ACC1SEJ0_9HYPO|nr:hypothetical protein NM208_g6064 [Fusarium decemcellulare]
MHAPVWLHEAQVDRGAEKILLDSQPLPLHPLRLRDLSETVPSTGTRQHETLSASHCATTKTPSSTHERPCAACDAVTHATMGKTMAEVCHTNRGRLRKELGITLEALEVHFDTESVPFWRGLRKLVKKRNITNPDGLDGLYPLLCEASHSRKTIPGPGQCASELWQPGDIELAEQWTEDWDRDDSPRQPSVTPSSPEDNPTPGGAPGVHVIFCGIYKKVIIKII